MPGFTAAGRTTGPDGAMGRAGGKFGELGRVIGAGLPAGGRMIGAGLLGAAGRIGVALPGWIVGPGDGVFGCEPDRITGCPWFEGPCVIGVNCFKSTPGRSGPTRNNLRAVCAAERSPPASQRLSTANSRAGGVDTTWRSAPPLRDRRRCRNRHPRRVSSRRLPGCLCRPTEHRVRSPLAGPRSTGPTG